MGELTNGVKRTKGGARAGAGRKPNPETVLARLAIAELDEEAEKSVRFIVNLRNDQDAPMSLRFAAAQDIINRRFGKPKQIQEVAGHMTLEQLLAGSWDNK